MTYKEFKKEFDAIFWRDGVHTDERFYSLFKLSAENIINSYDVLELIEMDENSAGVYRRIDSKYFLRPFATQNSESSLIDFENMCLINALLYLCASKMSIDKAAEYKSEFFKYINDYQNSLWDESCGDIEAVLKKNGYYRPYTITTALSGVRYNFDKAFLENLNKYLADVSSAKNLSYEKFIKLFIEFQDGKHQNREDLRQLDMTMRLQAIKGE